MSATNVEGLLCLVTGSSSGTQERVSRIQNSKPKFLVIIPPL